MAKKRTKIGFDPLAWMKNDSRESGVVSPESKKDSPESGVVSLESKEKAVPATPDSRLQTPDSRIDIGDALVLAHAARLHAEFEQALAQKKPLRLNLSRVQVADTAGVQLLLALRRDAEKRGIAASWEAPTQALCAAASQLGLSEALELPASSSAR